MINLGNSAVMGDSGFYKGTSAEQDGRWGDKQKKFLKSMKFPTEFSQKCDMSKVNLEVIKAWIAKRITGLLGFEDEVLIEFVFSLLEEPVISPTSTKLNLRRIPILGYFKSTLLVFWRIKQLVLSRSFGNFC